MKIKSFKYTFTESLKNIWRNGMMSVASISSVAAALLILGIVFTLIININSITSGAQEQYDSIQVYILDNLEEPQIQELGKKIESIEGVREIRFETKDEALKKMQASWQDSAYLLEGLEENPLPNAYEVRLTNINMAAQVSEQIKNLEGVEQVKFFKDIVERMLNVSKMIRNIGMIVIFMLLILSTFIINNTIKIAVNARRREINIMKYVGATNWFVRWPFFIEGTVLGLIGGLLSLGVVTLLYSYVHGIMTNQFYALIAAYIMPVNQVVQDLTIIFLVVGMGIGALGSLLSMRKYLNV